MRVVNRALVILVLIAIGGCDSALETGYMPKRLNASDAERRAYYAPQFSEESHPSKDTGSGPDLMPHH